MPIRPSMIILWMKGVARTGILLMIGGGGARSGYSEPAAAGHAGH